MSGTYEPKQKNIYRIASALNADEAWLMGFDMQMERKNISIEPSKGIKIPVLGRVPAGVPIEAVEEIIDYEEIPEEMAKDGEFFGLQIKELWKIKDDCYVQILLILLYSGMRVNELLKTKRKYCNLEERYLYIESEKNKTSIRKVPIHDKVFDFAKTFYHKDNTLLITNNDGYSVPYNNFATRQFKSLMQKKNWDHKIHDTRHTFISKAKECNCGELYLKKIVGHAAKDITTSVYTHIKLETLLKEIQKLKY